MPVYMTHSARVYLSIHVHNHPLSPSPVRMHSFRPPSVHPLMPVLSASARSCSNHSRRTCGVPPRTCPASFRSCANPRYWVPVHRHRHEACMRYTANSTYRSTTPTPRAGLFYPVSLFRPSLSHAYCWSSGAIYYGLTETKPKTLNYWVSQPSFMGFIFAKPHT